MKTITVAIREPRPPFGKAGGRGKQNESVLATISARRFDMTFITFHIKKFP
jgi:hypothetical protein